eukprot:2248109-Prymnesium_polylepis.1
MLLVLLEQRRRRDVEDAHAAVVEAARDRVFGRVVRDAARAALRQLELDQLLLRAVELPHADRAIARGGRKLAVVRVHREPVDDVRVRAHERHMPYRRHIEHADRAARGADEQLEAVGRRGERGDAPLVVRLEEVRCKVERPHAQLRRPIDRIRGRARAGAGGACLLVLRRWRGAPFGRRSR